MGRLYEVMQAFVLFIGQYASSLDEQFSTAHLVEDKSLFKALGAVWHQSDRQEGRIPEKLRKLDTDASWSVQRLDNVRTCLALATLSIQISMIANSIRGFPHRNISEMATAFR